MNELLVPVMWTLDEALALVRFLEPQLAAVGWHLALAGGVLLNGASSHDLDVVVYPHCRKSSHRPKIAGLRRALHKSGLWMRMSRGQLKREWRRKGSKDHKWVEVWMSGAKRIDVMILS